MLLVRVDEKRKKYRGGGRGEKERYRERLRAARFEARAARWRGNARFRNLPSLSFSCHASVTRSPILSQILSRSRTTTCTHIHTLWKATLVQSYIRYNVITKSLKNAIYVSSRLRNISISLFRLVCLFSFFFFGSFFLVNLHLLHTVTPSSWSTRWPRCRDPKTGSWRPGFD